MSEFGHFGSEARLFAKITIKGTGRLVSLPELEN